MQIKRLLVANRGEIAVRIVRAAQELGIHTILAHSSADKTSLAVQMADESIEIGPAQSSKSYLNQNAIVQAALETKADAIHPGYGFLAENAGFVRLVQQAGLIFVGPNAETIEMMGDKSQARMTAKLAGTPVVPGSEGVIDNPEQALEQAHAIGFPLMIKASAGGGGKGIRVVYQAENFVDAFNEAQREGLGAFGDGSVYLERFIERARHIEVQILGDGEHVVHCYERECSLQRRRQKVFEEAPSPVLTAEVREKLCASAVVLAKQVNYRGAGTLEYLYDDITGEFFFIEMNTRIQVEHPVTEMVTGIDLVREMLLVAGGQALTLQQSDIRIKGAAIECRINAEDPFNQFMPNVGTVTDLRWPSGPGVRVDSMLYQGYTVPPFYDSMLAKLVVWDEDREHALKRLRRALNETVITGLKTTVPLHLALLENKDVETAQFHTAYLETWLDSWNASKQ